MSRAEQQPGRFQPYNKETYQPEITAEALAVRIDQSFTKLLAELREGKTDRLLSFLAFSSRFHTYSPRNQQLIFDQRPDATQIASYATWKKEGFQVAKGEKGIRILIPKFPKGLRQRAEEADPDDEAANVQESKQRTRQKRQFITHHFTVGSVFDISQLRPEDQQHVPRFFTPIEGNYDTLYHRMHQAAEMDGIQVRETYHLLEGAQALSTRGSILIRPDLTAGAKAHSLAHEWAHEYLHTPQLRAVLPKQIKEGHAEAVAYVVSTHFGIPPDTSADYLRMWGNTPESLKKELKVVSKAASHIIAQIHKLNPGEAQFHDPQEPDQ